MLTIFTIYGLLFKIKKYYKLADSNIFIVFYLLHEATCRVSLQFPHISYINTRFLQVDCSAFHLFQASF
jgi:hypothetical protein